MKTFIQIGVVLAIFAGVLWSCGSLSATVFARLVMKEVIELGIAGFIIWLIFRVFGYDMMFLQAKKRKGKR